MGSEPSPLGVSPVDSEVSERVAVVVVDYHGGELLRDCLAGLALQTRRPDRVVLVDNGAEEPGPSRPHPDHPDVLVLRPGYNSGFARANNLALAEVSDCQWLALLNPDAVPDPTWLEQLLAAARRHPEAAAFGSRMYSDRGRTCLDGSGDVMHVSGLVWRRDHGRSASGWRLEGGEVFSPCAAAALYRRDLFERLGGFDEDFFCYIEDVDLGFRIRLAGYSCRYVPLAQVIHSGSALAGAKSDFALYHGHRNLLWLFVKNMPWPMLLVLAPLHLLMHIGVMLRYLPDGRGAVLYRAKRDAVLDIRRHWRKRARIQAERRIGLIRLLRCLSVW
ncbi:glycosyltransferase family 2 protein [Imhoffiella purpurea]|uniref:Putative glycosyltransferase n=1 Tax=Imhoffiella purpurea TaxID=1249627 RepID=W9V2C5_9GAMM|nr:glycosyltransferase family 2 protein [Imhoffiella purpurea]EXJ13469.1 Putative glycosyltransferase [Imhoffiella purpurea]